jgi:MFS transporter, DHA1 family, multidrug resistance protein
MFFLFPETSADNILLRRAQRLRKLTGNQNIHSFSEFNQRGIRFHDVMTNALIKPVEIMAKDPAILYANIYTGLVYAVYYSFYEVFPNIYVPIYGFTPSTTSLVFMCIIVASIIAAGIYIPYQKFYLIPDIIKNGLSAPERRLVPALFGVFGPTIGLFLFGNVSP